MQRQTQVQSSEIMVQSSESTPQTSVNMSQNMLDVTGFLKEVNLRYLPKEIKQTMKLSDLKLKCTIKYINKLTTKYGEKLLMEISIILLNQNVEYIVYLPDRFVKMPKPQIDILVSTSNTYFMYKGKDANGHHQIVFIINES
jgi:hypothetical protein